MDLKALCVAATASLSAIGGSAFAEDYPSRPVKFVVPFAAGGGNDIIARIVGEKLGDVWKVPVIIENRAGAGGNVGAEFVTAATPDGYTLFFSTKGLWPSTEVSTNKFDITLMHLRRFRSSRSRPMYWPPVPKISGRP